MGYSIIIAEGKQLRMVEMDVLKMASTKDAYQRLQLIYTKIESLIRQYHPDCCAIEAPFFGKNVQSMLKLGRAQGVAIASAMSAGLQVCEYSPKKIKQSITGNGNSDKEQVWKMLQQILSLKETLITYYDASDALAVAVCHHFQDNALLKTRAAKTSGWKQFISDHPHRLAGK